MNIPAAFDRAASHYDGAAKIQEDVAHKLLTLVPACAPRRILDIGCGTGLLTGLAKARWPDAEITGIDAAPSMLAVARAKLPDIRFIEADASALHLEEKFDLVLSSMALHWLPRPAESLQQWQGLVAPDGLLQVAVPVAGSLSEWKELCAQNNVTDRLWPFPSRADFVAAGPVLRHEMIFDSAFDFLKSLHQTGSGSAAPASIALSIAALRGVLRRAPRPFSAGFCIAYLAA